MGTFRKSQLKKRRSRKEKLAKLRAKYKSAKTELEKEKILEKVRKISPHLQIEDFLASIK